MHDSLTASSGTITPEFVCSCYFSGYSAAVSAAASPKFFLRMGYRCRFYRTILDRYELSNPVMEIFVGYFQPYALYHLKQPECNFIVITRDSTYSDPDRINFDLIQWPIFILCMEPDNIIKVHGQPDSASALT